MNTKQVQNAKRSVCRVLGVHRSFNYCEPYHECDDMQFGGTAFFVDPVSTFGNSFPIDVANKRFALTNFHVVEELVNKKCTLSYPDKGYNKISATVVYAVPALDVAVLMIDPYGEHLLWMDAGSISDFIDTIPNLKLETKNTIKGNSQNVMAIGFPNLSTDYQLCEGCISGRGLGMIQCTISFNGGNSGGPLMLKNKVIGICTASISDSEALGLAVPISQVVRFFQFWTKYDNILLSTPSWGMCTKTTTKDYLSYHKIDNAIQGAIVKKCIDIGGISKAKIKQNDILMGIRSGGNHYNIDNYGLVKVPWCDKRVPVENQEFIISLNPDDIVFDIFKWSTKKIRNDVKVRPNAIPFKVRSIYHCWEKVDYCMLGGCVFMNLSVNHLELEEDDDEPWCPPTQAIPLTNFLHSTLHMENTVVVTHIPLQSHISTQKLLNPFDRIIKCNGKKVKSATHLEQLIQECVQNYNDSNGEDKFIVLQTPSDKIYYDIEALVLREVQDVTRSGFPADKCLLLNMKTKKKRRRTYA